MLTELKFPLLPHPVVSYRQADRPATIATRSRQRMGDSSPNQRHKIPAIIPGAPNDGPTTSPTRSPGKHPRTLRPRQSATNGDQRARNRAPSEGAPRANTRRTVARVLTRPRPRKNRRSRTVPADDRRLKLPPSIEPLFGALERDDIDVLNRAGARLGVGTPAALRWCQNLE